MEETVTSETSLDAALPESSTVLGKKSVQENKALQTQDLNPYLKWTSKRGSLASRRADLNAFYSKASGILGVGNHKRKQVKMNLVKSLRIGPPDSRTYPVIKKKTSEDYVLSKCLLYGNYPNYYNRRSKIKPENDPRLGLIEKAWLENRFVLDVGCNSGEFTIELAIRFSPSKIFGIDIDESLIQKAHRNVQNKYSPTVNTPEFFDNCSDSPSTSVNHSNFDANDDWGSTSNSTPITHVESETEDHTVQKSNVVSKKYIDKNNQDIFNQTYDRARDVNGMIPVLCDVKTDQGGKFPRNINFRCCDWMKEKVEFEKYDTILAFFHKVYNFLKPGGFFVLEPQEFDTYRKYKNLSEFKPADFEEFLLNEVGFSSFRKLSNEEPFANKGS
ncbi:hypothetical protein G9A89_008133 [Geosiphon pyriformis]|nr:hypothetical protein G9A89_008133 [Geosiphon pyriformis]